MTGPRATGSSGAARGISSDHEALAYKMAMALNAADFGEPIGSQAASVCAEIAAQHCAEVHRTATVPVVDAAAGRAGQDPVPS